MVGFQTISLVLRYLREIRDLLRRIEQQLSANKSHGGNENGH